jgi:hypothetical protein
MTADSTPPSDGDEPRLSWRERELLTALRRLANSQAQVRSLEEAMRNQSAVAPPEPGDVERIEALESELEKLRAKAAGRFGGGAARDRLPEVEMQQRLVLERLGFESYDDFVVAGRRPVRADERVDPAILDFARRELHAAEETYAELLAMPDDVDEAPAAPQRIKRDFGERPDPDEAEMPATIDLTRGERA